MKRFTLNKRKMSYIPLGFVIPFLWMLIIMILGGVLPFGNKSLLYSDGYHQYYPFFKEFRRALLSGESLLYSWNVGMGIDYLGLISYYVASPLNLLSIFVPEEGLLYYFTFLTPIRLGLAGLFFSIFLNKVFKKNDWSIPLFSSFYALCAWSLGYQWNVMWLDTFLLLPLVALGTYSLLKENRFFLYTISLFLSIFSNYYIGFFTCIFVLLTFICYQICCWNGFKKFIFDLLRIALFSILAIGLTAILELPTLASIQTTQSSVNKFPEKFDLNIVDSGIYKPTTNTNWVAAKEAWQNGNHAQALSLGWISFKTALSALLDGMKQIAGNTTGGTNVNFKEADALPNLYCGVITLFFSVLFLTCKQVKIREKLCSVVFLVFLMLSFLIRQLDYIWHGFHFTNMIPYRFSFIYSFIMLYMAYRAYLLRRSIKLWQIGVATILATIPVVFSNDFSLFITTISANGYWQSLSLAISNFNFSIGSIEYLISYLDDFYYPAYNFLLIICTAVLLTIGTLKAGYKKAENRQEKRNYIFKFRNRQKVTAILLLCLLTTEIVLNMVNYSYYWSGAKISDYPKGLNNSTAIFSKLHELEEEQLFFRAETSHSQILNDAALNQYNGISTFTSSANVSITRFMENLGYGAKDTYNRYCYESSSPVADLFLNIKYVVDRDGFYYEGPIIRTNSETGQKYTSQKKAYSNPYYDVIEQASLVALTENNAYLPLGFMCETSLADFDFSSNTNQYEFEENLIAAATGYHLDLWHPVDGQNLSIFGDNNVSITSKDGFGKCRYKAIENGVVTFAFTSDRAGLFCIDVSQGKRNGFSVWLNDNHDANPDERIYSESYSLPQMLSVCEVQPGDVVEVQFKCVAGDSARIEVYGAILDENAFREAHNKLSASTLNLTEFHNTFIQGTVSCNNDGLLYTSIPQNGENWSVYVDGQPSKIKLIGDVMIGVELSKGTHEITFRYENRAFKLGSIISAICATTFLTLFVICYKPYKDIKKLIIRIRQINLKNFFRPKGKYDK